MAVLGLERALTLLSRRVQVLAHNLANANTPAFLRRDVPFYELMRATLKGLDLPVTPAVIDLSPLVRADGNNTSPERELAALTETALLYRTTLQLAAKELDQLRSAITEGRR